MEASRAGLVKATQTIRLEDIKIDNIKEVLVDPNMLDQARHFISSNVSVSYGIMFTVCAFAYLIAWGLMKALVPRHTVITDL
jgi:ACS family hexuronate transporter-like MFS transporter